MTDQPTSADFQHAQLDWDADGQPRSRQFADVYFANDGGLVEARHAFLLQNGLARRFAALPQRLITISHDPAAVAHCARVIWLEAGAVRMDGPAAPVLRSLEGEAKERAEGWIRDWLAEHRSGDLTAR